LGQIRWCRAAFYMPPLLAGYKTPPYKKQTQIY
jgi:hypothetical protein